MITRRQADVAKIISDIVYKGLALIVVLGLLVAGFSVFIYALLKLADRPLGTAILGGIDLMLGVILHQVYKSLFPTPAKS